MTSTQRAELIAIKYLNLAQPSFFEKQGAVLEHIELPPSESSQTLVEKVPDASRNFTSSFHSEPFFPVDSSLSLESEKSDHVYLGTLSGYVSISNCSLEDVYDIGVRMELSVGSGMFYTLVDTNAAPQKKLARGTSLEFIVSHRIGVCEQHVLTCSATYSTTPGGQDKKTISQKLHEFVAEDPLDVAYKATVTTRTDNMFLEARVGNATMFPIVLESVKFVVTEALQSSVCVEDYGTNMPFTVWHPRQVPAVSDKHLSDVESELLQKLLSSSEMSCMEPGDKRQYLYRLALPSDLAAAIGDRSDFEVGYLSIQWRFAVGEASSYGTKAVLWKKRDSMTLTRLSYDPRFYSDGSTAPTKCNIEFAIVGIPARVVVEEPFSLSLQIQNLSSETSSFLICQNDYDDVDEKHKLRDASSSLANDEPRNQLLMNGAVEVNVGKIESRKTKVVSLNLFPAEAGVQSLSSLVVRNTDSGVAVRIPSDICVFVGQ